MTNSAKCRKFLVRTLFVSGKQSGLSVVTVCRPGYGSVDYSLEIEPFSVETEATVMVDCPVAVVPGRIIEAGVLESLNSLDSTDLLFREIVKVSSDPVAGSVLVKVVPHKCEIFKVSLS